MIIMHVFVNIKTIRSLFIHTNELYLILFKLNSNAYNIETKGHDKYNLPDIWKAVTRQSPMITKSLDEFVQRQVMIIHNILRKKFMFLLILFIPFSYFHGLKDIFWQKDTKLCSVYNG